MRLGDKIMLTCKMKLKKLQEVDLNKFMRSRGLHQSFLDARQAKTRWEQIKF